MRISIVGTGYVGLVTGTCLAEMGNDVICVDINNEKIEKLKQGIIPIYEPGLEEMVKRNYKEKRLLFTTDMKYAVENSTIVYIAVGTPPREDGSADMSYVYAAAKDIGRYMNGYKIVVDKSTVPVGTAEKVKAVIDEQLNERNVEYHFDIVSNPEFLKEGAAIEDFMKPDRVVIGADSSKPAEIMKELYNYFVRNGHPVIVMDIKSAEMTKYAANCMLATKISFINEMADICEKVGADIDFVRQGIGSDSRIGYKFLYPGPGYGGSCFPKDVQALIKTAEENECQAEVLKAVHNANDRQKRVLLNKVEKHFGKDLSGMTFAVWGLAFKPKTNDMRQSPAITIVNGLIERGASVRAYDPEAMEEAKKIFKTENIVYAENSYDALTGCDALIIITEWGIFRSPDFDRIKILLKNPIVFDGRNIYKPQEMQDFGFTYYSIGRADRT